MRRSLPLVASLLATLCAAPLAARTIYVNNVAGDDVFDGLAERSHSGDIGPVRTLARALTMLQPGDQISLANTGEPYRECLGLSAATHCGTPFAPLVIDGHGATLDGSWPIPNGAWELHQGAVFRACPPRKSYQQLFREGKPLVRKANEPTDAGPPKLQPLEWALHQGTMYFCVEQGKLPADYHLSFAAMPVGITLYHVHDVVITNLTVQGFQLDGINAHDGTRRCLLSGVTCRGNGRSGVAICGCSRLELAGCLIGDNGTAQVYAEGVSVTKITGSHILDNTALPILRRGGKVLVDGQ